MAKKIVLLLIECQAYFFLLHHFPHINEGISHSAKGRIYANVSNISNFLKAKSRIVAKNNYFPLVVGQLAYKFPDIFLDLPFYKMIFNICFCKLL